MNIYTNENNTCTLKLLIAANLGSKRVEIKKAALGDAIFAGPRALPFLEVDDELSFFSSNAAAQFLFPVLDLSENGLCQQMQEWEATRLYPAVQCVLSSKSPAADLKQLLTSQITDLDKVLATKKYVLGDKLTAADISIYSTLYPLYFNEEQKQLYLKDSKNVDRWIGELTNAKAVQDAIKAWGGSTKGPFSMSSALGLPQVASLLSSVSSPSEQVVSGPTSEEVDAAKESWDTVKPAPRVPQDKVILPVKDRRNVLITASLPYVNNVPHLGNIIGCVLSADIYARYCRLCNYNTLFVCGTDEYGTATETKALEEGVTPRQICDKYYAIHNDVYRWFNIGFDHFGRTSTPEQERITQKMYWRLKENGFITSQSVDQLHCPKCDRFLADRFVEGWCPQPGCGYDNARGDQCDKCGKLVNPVELIQPRCKVCGTTPTLRASQQLFLELGQLEAPVRKFVNERESHWSPPARGVARAWLKEGLKPRAITRDLKWGVPVPEPGFENKVFYVWFDAPMGYMSITECATKHYEKWFKPNPEHDVKWCQFMAKDNVPFHAIMFPATLLGVNDKHVLVHHLFATEYLNYEEGKFSKSRGVGVFGTDAQDTGIPSDVWRFYLASVRPETSDSSFSWQELGTRNNSELLNNLGNFCHRSLSFCWNSFKGRVPEVKPSQVDYELMALVNREVAAYVQDMENGKIREALRRVLSISKLGNQHMQSEQPWVLLKGSDEDKQRGATAIGVCCHLAALLCVLLSPYMPDTCRRLAKQLNIDLEKLSLMSQKPCFARYLPEGHVITSPEPLFSKLEADKLTALKEKYAGTQSDRKNGDAKSESAAFKSKAEIEEAITKQGEVVRKLKSSTKDKTVWQPEVDKLLALKKQLADFKPAQAQASSGSNVTAQDLEKAIAEQGDVVRKIKASTKDKTVWTPEVNKLLALKKQLADLNATPAVVTSAATTGKSVAELEKAIAEQGDKVRKLKSSTKDKAVWQPEVNVLLDLKKQLAALQINK